MIWNLGPMPVAALSLKPIPSPAISKIIPSGLRFILTMPSRALECLFALIKALDTKLVEMKRESVIGDHKSAFLIPAGNANNASGFED
jgi:hypothetical protein